MSQIASNMKIKTKIASMHEAASNINKRLETKEEEQQEKLNNSLIGNVKITKRKSPVRTNTMKEVRALPPQNQKKIKLKGDLPSFTRKQG